MANKQDKIDARDRQTSGSKSSDRKNDKKTSNKATSASNKPDFSSSSKDTVNVNTDLPPTPQKSIDEILAEAGFSPDPNAPENPPNPEMGGSSQRQSQKDLIDSPEFERFLRDVKDENTITDHIIDFFSPIKSVPTINQETGEFGVTSEFNPAKMSPSTRMLDTLFDLGLTTPLDDFTSSSDLAERRRDKPDETSGAQSSDRRDDDSGGFSRPGGDSFKTPPPGAEQGNQDEIDLLAQFFEDFFANFGGFGGPITSPQQGLPGTGQPVNPNFQLIGNPDFIAKVTGNPNFSNSGG